jgi:UDP-N-acetylglucosamine 4,6-dehydratase
MLYLEKSAVWLRSLNGLTKAWAMAGLDFCLLFGIVTASYCIRQSSFRLPEKAFFFHYYSAPLLGVLAIASLGVYSAAARGYSRSTEWKIFLSQIIVVILWLGIVAVLGREGFVRSVVLIYFMFASVTLSASRQFASWLSRSAYSQHFKRQDRPRVIIHGAGREGILLADSLQKQGRLNVVAFLETDASLVGRTVAGLRVFSAAHPNTAINKYAPSEVLIAKPKQDRVSIKPIVESYIDFGLTVKIVPDIEQITSGEIDLSRIRKINVEDLLGRDPVPPDRGLMEKSVFQKSVMVTGAGGSIGSEIVRQVFTMRPSRLLLYEFSEHKLFEIHREIEEAFSKSGFTVPILGNVEDDVLLKKTIQDNGVDVIFHAAAYKHVRMIQENPLAGIRTNVFGTIKVAEIANQCGVGLFVLISTDKAVRPSSVMGATKRISEMFVQALASQQNQTTFAIVRFGNVLASSGSVVPIFQHQIERGGPVLVTDPEATRYFMLIPEAAQLVVQASAMAERAEVYVLDMGEPVSILKLAESMIELAGYSVKSSDFPDGDIEIKFIGLREGEKLHEELQIGSSIEATSHPRILLSHEVFMEKSKLEVQLSKLKKAVSNDNTHEALRLVMQLASWKNKLDLT